jgi:Flp pilus assembly protein TadD
VRLSPDHAQAHGSLGIALGERGRLAEAEHHLREAVRLDPNDQLARNTLAEVVRLRATVRRKK